MTQVWFTVDCARHSEREDVDDYIKRVHKINAREYGSMMYQRKTIDYCCRSVKKRNAIRKDLKKTFPKVRFITYAGA